MAAAPKAVPEQTDPLLKEMNALVDRARIDRAKHDPRIADCYRYTMPWRHKFNDKTQATVTIDEIFDELPGTVLEDFAADMLNTFTPQKNDWVSIQPVVTLDTAGERKIGEDLKKYQRVVFDAMARSNLYMALQESYLDLGPGTMALCVTDIDPAKPFHCEAIPAPNLLLAKGPFGFVTGTFREGAYLRSEIVRMWPDANVSLLDAGAAKPAAEQSYDIIDGCWRDWSDRANEVYHYVVQGNGKKLYHKKYIGAGSCPFIVARWGRDSTTAWGVGPTYRVLPAIKTLNHFAYLTLKNYDKHVDPPTSYEDDGVMNVDNGVNPGDWIPRAPGSEKPEVIESKAKFDVEAVQIDDKRSAIKRAHYQDRPEQQGKTPPTATQWADEAAERARRMGTPATALVHELQYPLINRFAYLLAERGKLPKVRLDGEEIALQPVSPLLRAQEQEEVVRNDRFAELIAARFGPQIAMVVIDVVKYAAKQGRLLGVDSELIRDDAKMQAAIEQLMPVLQSTGFLPGSTPDVAVPQSLPA